MCFIFTTRVYCKYHYLEGHEYPSPETELRLFLRKLSKPTWKWFEQYEGDLKSDADNKRELFIFMIDVKINVNDILNK